MEETAPGNGRAHRLQTFILAKLPMQEEGSFGAFELCKIHFLACLPPRSSWANFNSPALTFTPMSCKVQRHFSLA